MRSSIGGVPSGIVWTKRATRDKASPHRRGLLAWMIGPAGVFALGLVAAIGLPPSAARANLCVNPGGSGGCFSSVQAAVDAAGVNEIVDVAAGTYVENVYLAPSKRISIQGAGPGLTTLSGDGIATVFYMDVGASAVLRAVRIEGGRTGIVVARGRLDLEDCEISGNGTGMHAGSKTRVSFTASAVTGNGPPPAGPDSLFVGGIVSDGRLRIVGSRVSGNVGTHSPFIPGTIGGVWSSFHGRLDLIESTVSDNVGKGILVDRNLLIERSTISGNSSGGVRRRGSRGAARIRNSTISGNDYSSEDGSGGGLEASNVPVILDRVTIAGNSATVAGGGIATGPEGSKITMRASIIADNSAPIGNDCSSSGVRVSSTSLIENTAGCTILASQSITVLNADPLLGPLQDNGGPTETQALGLGSPATGVVVAGNLCRVPDQRGVVRSVPCDLGAFELP